ncbi:hypothetical protein [Fictibacillus barbaricus]|uniref:hypothetical protein n=1 Tax=Fictibacillus barbaricus TaxID=182136 RepID=UPI001667A9D9|nr:hypothetical protein [Fictibacillus barbaricus]
MKSSLLIITMFSSLSPCPAKLNKFWISQNSQKRGVRLISLTHFNNNFLQDHAEVNLYCYSPAKKLNEYNVTDKTPVMLVLRALAEYYWQAHG